MNEASKEPKLSLDVALQRYRHHLIGVAVVPTVFFVGVECFQLPYFALAPFFFAAFFHAGWPCIAKGAPYSFWLVACGVWMIGGGIAALLVGIVSAIQALFTTHQP